MFKPHTIGGLPSYFRFGPNPTSDFRSSGLESGYQSQASGTQVSGKSEQSSCDGITGRLLGSNENANSSASMEKTVSSTRGDSAAAVSSTSSQMGEDRSVGGGTSDSAVAKPKLSPASPLLFDRSPHEEEDEEEMVFEVWVVSAAAHCSVATVIEYCGQFISIEV